MNNSLEIAAKLNQMKAYLICMQSFKTIYVVSTCETKYVLSIHSVLEM